MVTPVIGGIGVAALCWGACSVKFLRNMNEKKVNDIAFDVFASIAITAVAALHFQIAVMPNILILSMCSMCLLIVMQMVDVCFKNNKVMGDAQ